MINASIYGMDQTDLGKVECLCFIDYVQRLTFLRIEVALMSPAQEQFYRLKRYLVRMEQMRASDDATDDLYSFFLHAWHLIDWASNDPTVGRTYLQVKADVPNSIHRCADIANHTKHLVLTKPPRPAPQITRKNIRITPGENRPAEASFIFTFTDNSTIDALQLAREVVADWGNLLKRYGLLL